MHYAWSHHIGLSVSSGKILPYTLSRQVIWPLALFQVDDVLLKKDVALIIILCPPSLHSQIAVKALGIGKHVVCGVPGGLDQPECLRMVQVCSQLIPRPRRSETWGDNLYRLPSTTLPSWQSSLMASASFHPWYLSSSFGQNVSIFPSHFHRWPWGGSWRRVILVRRSTWSTQGSSVAASLNKPTHGSNLNIPTHGSHLNISTHVSHLKIPTYGCNLNFYSW